MHGNNPYSGNPNTDLPAGQVQPPGIDPESLSQTERDSLRQFATEVAAKTETHLPNDYQVDTTFHTAHGTVSLGVMVACPNGARVQCDIQPTPADVSETSSEDTVNTDNRNGEVAEISHGLAAAAVLQVKHMDEYDDSPPTAA